MEMKAEKYIILLIDPDFTKYYKNLSDSITECEIIPVFEKEMACEFFFHSNIDLVLLDHNKNNSCTELLQFFTSVKPSIPVIIMTDCGSEDLAVNVFRRGARDYFKKPVEMDEFLVCIEAALGAKDSREMKKFDYYSNSLGRAIKYMDKNYSTKITLSLIAKEAGMSVSCFERTFKKKMGITFTTYLNNLRISKAIRMLKKGDFSISETAFACGFTNPSHFTRTFKKIINTSPKFYRKSLKK